MENEDQLIKELLENKSIQTQQLAGKMGITTDELDAMLEDLEARGLVMVHKNHRSPSPRYDSALLTDYGREKLSEDR